MRHRIPNLFWISSLSFQQSRCVTSFRPRIQWSSNIPTRLAHINGNHPSPLSFAEEAFSVLAKKKRTWTRLRHVVDLAQQTTTNNNSLKTIVDIGTDHGILPIAFAADGRFEKVSGIDISEQVLRDGAMALYKELEGRLESLSSLETARKMSSIEFCLGDGLKGIKAGDADVVCVAGMGVNTMLKILVPSETDRTGCRLLLLQPTNSKPRNLILLYDTLQQGGWKVLDERIEHLSGRWYLSVAFSRTEGRQKSLKTEKPDLPGIRLWGLNNTAPMKETFNDYIQHHQSWLAKDAELPSGLHESEQRWTEAYTDDTP